MQEVSKLKEELDGEIVVAGSIRLVRTLMENDLVDELRLMIYPVCSGRRAPSARPATKGRCASSRRTVRPAYLTYESSETSSPGGGAMGWGGTS